MKSAYSTYFENPFETLRMDRPAYKAQAEYSLHAVTTAALGAPVHAAAGRPGHGHCRLRREPDRPQPVHGRRH